MRRAFIDATKTGEPVRKYSGPAKKYIDTLERIKKPQIADLIILCTLKHTEKTSGPTTEPLLDRIIAANPVSAWRDWAYWEKARVVASKTASSTHNWGLAHFTFSDGTYVTCSASDPYVAVRGRAAVAFLRDYPKSYMKAAFLDDLFAWRYREASLAVKQLLSEADVMEVPSASEQVKNLKAICERLRMLSKGRLGNKLKCVENELDNRLWGDFHFNNPKKFIIEYFNVLVELKGKDVLSHDIYKWLLTQPKTPKTKWTRWEPTSAPTTRPATKPQQNTEKP